MQPMTSLTDDLIALAARSIEHGLGNAEAGSFDVAGIPEELLETRATFVTLSTLQSGLRGCRGLLEARYPLSVDVWHNAYASAFDDPRFPPVNAGEFTQLDIEISVLGDLAPLVVVSEQELRRRLVPRRDGVVLSWRGRRATFLPKVWEDVPDVGEFLAHLKLKAGLPWDFWASDIQIQIYTTQIISGRVGSYRTQASVGSRPGRAEVDRPAVR
jgi:AmmeMemoRadiSam system protein A